MTNSMSQQIAARAAPVASVALLALAAGSSPSRPAARRASASAGAIEIGVLTSNGGHLGSKVVQTVPDVDQTFGGRFGADSPAPEPHPAGHGHRGPAAVGEMTMRQRR